MRCCRMLAPLLVLIAACTQPSTLSQPGQETNHAEVSALSGAPPDLTSAVDPEQALFTYVDARAQALASREYEPPPQILPAALAALTYEQYRAIQFRQEMSLWQDEHRFTVQVLHPGFLYTEPVEIHLVQDTDVERLPFMQARYRYVGPAAPVADQIAGDIGHAGFRVYYPRGGPDNREEVAVFLGASYFRLVGHQQVHGLSARGLAVDAGLDSGEEFPAFRTFWLIQPDPDATQLTFFALLDSPSVTGAYRFDLDPARHTTLTVNAHLYARHDVTKLGVAPMSSMFLYGPNRLPAFDDFRPQVHDSDGVLMHTARDEWIWRPLNNGPGLRITSLRDDTPQGFGLVQRERQFASYLDLQARYHQRPATGLRLEMVLGVGAGLNCSRFRPTPNSMTTLRPIGFPTHLSTPAICGSISIACERLTAVWQPRHSRTSSEHASAGMRYPINTIRRPAVSAGSLWTSLAK